MSRIALVGPGNVILREDEADRIDPSAGVDVGLQWLPIVDVVVGTPGPDANASAPVLTFPGGQVTRTVTWTPLTQGQLDARDLSAVVSQTDAALGKAMLMVFNTLFFIANDVRTRHSQSALTLQQFRNAVEGLDTIDQAAFREWVLDLTRQ